MMLVSLKDNVILFGQFKIAASYTKLYSPLSLGHVELDECIKIKTYIYRMLVILAETKNTVRKCKHVYTSLTWNSQQMVRY